MYTVGGRQPCVYKGQNWEEGIYIYVENYLPLLERDIQEITTNVSEQMPQAIKYALEAELRKLEAMRGILIGAGDEKKSVLHSLRANLRYTRKRLGEEKDHAKRKALEQEVRRIEFEISKAVHTTELQNK